MESLTDLKNMAQEMAGHYLAGVGAALQGMMSNTSLYVKGHGDLSHTSRTLDEIEGFYGGIPFEQLPRDEAHS
ncbi:MAG: hypothetical protein HY518_03380 [Candidatus Aenigmarchaeota archaeon]|nr:hypothetical protein [Candidatus Aenigmarchaeota archaeon]